MDYISYIILAVIAFIAGWHARGVIIMAHLATNPEKMISILNKIKEINAKEAQGDFTSSEGTELNIERVGDMLYAYSKETNQFIAQGQDLKTLLDEAQKRFPNDKFFGYIPNGDSAKELV